MDWEERAREIVVDDEQVAVVDLPAVSSEEGPPLLVLHGFPTSSIDFQSVIDELSARRRVVLTDFPGFGLSAKPDRPYSLFGQADVVEAVTAALGLNEVDLLTHDMGDSVGGELMARSLVGNLGFRVRRRVITNGSIYLAMAQLTDGQKFLQGLPDEMLPEDAAPDAEALTSTLATLCATDTQSDETRDRLRAGAELIVRGGGNRLLPRLIRYLDERAQHELRWSTAIETHPSPLTIVWGRHDPIAVAEMADRLVRRRSDASLIWLDAGHWPMIEQPKAFAQATLDALDG